MICSEQRENATYISKLDWNRRVAARIRRFSPPIDEILMEVAVSRCGSQLIMCCFPYFSQLVLQNPPGRRITIRGRASRSRSVRYLERPPSPNHLLHASDGGWRFGTHHARLVGFHFFHDLHDSLVSTSSTTCTTHWFLFSFATCNSLVSIYSTTCPAAAAVAAAAAAAGCL